MLSNFTIDRGMLAVDGLIHAHPTGDIPPNNRVYRMTLFLSDGTPIHVDSNPFQITGKKLVLRATLSYLHACVIKNLRP